MIITTAATTSISGDRTFTNISVKIMFSASITVLAVVKQILPTVFTLFQAVTLDKVKFVLTPNVLF